MSGASELTRRHFQTLLEEARSQGVPDDVVGRTMLAQIVECWLAERPWTDVAEELRFTADSLDPDRDFEFMRP